MIRSIVRIHSVSIIWRLIIVLRWRYVHVVEYVVIVQVHVKKLIIKYIKGNVFQSNKDDDDDDDNGDDNDDDDNDDDDDDDGDDDDGGSDNNEMISDYLSFSFKLTKWFYFNIYIGTVILMVIMK